MNDRAFSLAVVDGLKLDEKYRRALKPGEMLPDRRGRLRRLPRFFYEIDSWQTAMKTPLTPNFYLWEFISTDVREAEVIRSFPRYVPCAIMLTAPFLQTFREKIGTYVRIAANGGYRSPSHALTRYASPHNWGTAVNIYQIGNDFLDNQEKIEFYNAIATKLFPTVWSRPYGHGIGYADDHLHLDLGYITLVPNDAAGEEE
jgi:hypothetical protein